MFPLELVIFAVGIYTLGRPINDLKDSLKGRFDEIIQAINSRDSLLEEFDEQIFNALVEKIEILTLTHFVFELKSGMRVDGIEK